MTWLWIFALFYALFSSSTTVAPALINVTLDNTDASISYQPASSWTPNSLNCTLCIQSAFNKTYIVGGGGSGGMQLKSPSNNKTTESGKGGHDHDGSEGAGNDGRTLDTLRLERVLDDKKDGDNDSTSQRGPGPGDREGETDHKDRPDEQKNETMTGKGGMENGEDSPVTLQFQFTGSAVYLFVIVPPANLLNSSTPPTTDFRFTLDNQTFPGVNQLPTPSPSDIDKVQINIPIFTATNLTHLSHHLVVTVGSGSPFFFDYIVFSKDSDGTSTVQNGVLPGSQGMKIYALSTKLWLAALIGAIPTLYVIS